MARHGWLGWLLCTSLFAVGWEHEAPPPIQYRPSVTADALSGVEPNFSALPENPTEFFARVHPELDKLLKKLPPVTVEAYLAANPALDKFKDLLPIAAEMRNKDPVELIQLADERSATVPPIRRIAATAELTRRRNLPPYLNLVKELAPALGVSPNLALAMLERAALNQPGAREWVRQQLAVLQAKKLAALDPVLVAQIAKVTNPGAKSGVIGIAREVALMLAARNVPVSPALVGEIKKVFADFEKDLPAYQAKEASDRENKSAFWKEHVAKLFIIEPDPRGGFRVVPKRQDEAARVKAAGEVRAYFDQITNGDPSRLLRLIEQLRKSDNPYERAQAVQLSLALSVPVEEEVGGVKQQRQVLLVERTTRSGDGAGNNRNQGIDLGAGPSWNVEGVLARLDEWHSEVAPAHYGADASAFVSAAPGAQVHATGEPLGQTKLVTWVTDPAAPGEVAAAAKPIRFLNPSEFRAASKAVVADLRPYVPPTGGSPELPGQPVPRGDLPIPAPVVTDGAPDWMPLLKDVPEKDIYAVYKVLKTGRNVLLDIADGNRAARDALVEGKKVVAGTNNGYFVIDGIDPETKKFRVYSVKNPGPVQLITLEDFRKNGWRNSVIVF